MLQGYTQYRVACLLLWIMHSALMRISFFVRGWGKGRYYTITINEFLYSYVHPITLYCVVLSISLHKAASRRDRYDEIESNNIQN